MFIDYAQVHLKAGDGARGCKSFYRDKYTRHGIPDGGDGGKGGDIIFVADRNIFTLLDFKFRQHLRAPNGKLGSSKKQKGKDGENLVVRVPIGTLVIDKQTNCLLRDLDEEGASVVAARGGKGGLGNRHKCEPTPGETGEERTVALDLKLIADVGLIGFPNAGKSTLISAISNAHPKIANYPFTTREPVLGVVKTEDKSFIVADVPGLIAGSSKGKGLGFRFLRHIERTRILAHVIDMAGQDGRDPLSDYRVLNKELKSYSKDILAKHQILVANKMDLEEAKANLARFRKAVRKKIYPISALKEEGLEELVEAIRQKL